jgi:hypothetical protein
MKTLHPLSEGELAALVAKTANCPAKGEFELFKTSSVFDGTAQHPEWLGEEPKRVTNLMPA